MDASMAAVRRSFGPDDLQPEIDHLGIAGTIVVQALPSLEETAELLATAAITPFVRGVVGWVDLTSRHVSTHIQDLRAGPGGEWLVGIRHQVHDEDDPDWLRRDHVLRGLAVVEAAGLVFDLLVRTRELPAAVEVGRDLPQLRLVLDHLAKPPIASRDLSAWGRQIMRLAALPNVSAKISGLVTEAEWRTWSIDDVRPAVELAIDAFGPDRLMLGSDWPVCLLAGTYIDVMDTSRFLLFDLPVHHRDAICGGNAVRTYGLSIGSS
jgi:L-fuconolactonase